MFNFFTFKGYFTMAVPKKRTSKTKKNLRKSVWKNQTQQALKSLSAAKSAKSRALKKMSSSQAIGGEGFQKSKPVAAVAQEDTNASS